MNLSIISAFTLKIFFNFFNTVWKIIYIFILWRCSYPRRNSHRLLIFLHPNMKFAQERQIVLCHDKFVKCPVIILVT